MIPERPSGLARRCVYTPEGVVRMQQGRRLQVNGALEVNGTMVWLIFALLITLLAIGCHGDTNQGGGTDQGHAGKPGAPAMREPRVPTPPTADQIDPSSPQAVLHGSSTTQTGAAPGTGATAQPR